MTNDPISSVMREKGMTFPDAVEFLATDRPPTETIFFWETLPKTGSDGLLSTATPGSGWCPWCSSESKGIVHTGPCPRIKSIEYHKNGTIKRVEFNDE